jgi:hypothetical protein
LLRIECQGCHTSAYADCTCAASGRRPDLAGAHTPGCPLSDLGAQVTCRPGFDCCDGSDHPDVSHDAAANACPGGHDDAACPEPKTCKTWAGMTADTRHPQYEGEPPGDCPGGHCHKDLDGCTVCRPVSVEVMPGGANVQTVGA